MALHRAFSLLIAPYIDPPAIRTEAIYSSRRSPFIIAKIQQTLIRDRYSSSYTIKTKRVD